jgi:hypothetical protein
LKGVQLIDFSRLRIIPERLLGTGSSARVYEGRCVISSTVSLSIKY